MPDPRPANQKPRPWEKGAEGEATSFGNWLRRQREMREITLREIADTTKVSLRYLEAFEQDRFDALPAPVFARGFLREYARYVGLDPDEVVNHFLSVHQAAQPPRQPQEGEDYESGRSPSETQWRYGLVLGFALVVLLGLIALAAFLAERRGEADEQGGATVPVTVAPPPPPSAPQDSESEPVEEAAPLRVTLEFREECWVEAVMDGNRRVSELRLQGESMQLEAEESVVLTLGNPPGVQVEVNGHALDLARSGGQVLRGLRIDLDTVRALDGESS